MTDRQDQRREIVDRLSEVLRSQDPQLALEFLDLIRGYEREARTDPLTRVLNRRGFEEAARSMLRKAQEHSRGIAYFAIDNDHFKKVNDLTGYQGILGHAGGDKLIQDSAAILETLSSAVRPADLVGRLGGDEWAVLMYDLSEKDAVHAAHRVSQRFEEKTGHTISIGAVVYNPPPRDIRLKDLKEEADRALYRVKGNKASGLRVEVYSPSLVDRSL